MMAPWQTNLLACPRNCYGPNRPPIESIHPPNSQQPATKQARRASTQTIQKRVFLFTILRRLKHRKRQRALRACRTDCRNRANNTDAAPKTNWQLWAAGSPKKLNTIQPAWLASKHCPAQRGRRRSTAQLSVAGVEALPRRRISCESVVTAAARRARRPPAHHPTTPTPATTRATPASAGPGATTLVLLAICSRSPGLPLARSAAGSAALGCSSR